VPVRTFADWNEPPAGSMEMDLVAHCGDANRGSYSTGWFSPTLASGWTEAAPLVVRESGLVVRLSIAFAKDFPLRFAHWTLITAVSL
jgi:hypothetical protein